MKDKKEHWLIAANAIFLSLVVVIGIFFIASPAKRTHGTVPSVLKKVVYVSSSQTGDGLEGLDANKDLFAKPAPVEKNTEFKTDKKPNPKPQSNKPSEPAIKSVGDEKTITTASKKVTDTKSNQPSKQEKADQTTKATSNQSIKQQTSKQNTSFHEIYEVPKGYCAITFDDGPSAYTEKIAQLLKNDQIPATFFFIGENVKRFPKAVAVANKLGFGIGDHSYSHPQLNKMSETAQSNQILNTKKQIESIIKKPVTLFRPPYGAFNNQTKDVLIKNHMQMVLWNDDPRDWATKNPSLIAQKIKSSQLNGKVIILHDQKQTWEALPQIIKVIKAQGLKIKAI